MSSSIISKKHRIDFLTSQLQNEEICLQHKNTTVIDRLIFACCLVLNKVTWRNSKTIILIFYFLLWLCCHTETNTSWRLSSFVFFFTIYLVYFTNYRSMDVALINWRRSLWGNQTDNFVNYSVPFRIKGYLTIVNLVKFKLFVLKKATKTTWPPGCRIFIMLDYLEAERVQAE